MITSGLDAASVWATASMSCCPVAQYALILILRPSTHPRSCSPERSASKQGDGTSARPSPNQAMLRIRSRCCALAASGHATAAPPSSDVNARRFMFPPRLDKALRRIQPLLGPDVRIANDPCPLIDFCFDLRFEFLGRVSDRLEP